VSTTAISGGVDAASPVEKPRRKPEPDMRGRWWRFLAILVITVVVLVPVFAVGRMAPVVAGAARGAGLAGATEFGDIETAGLAVKEFVRSGDVILLKASRATRLERIGIILRGDEKAAAKQIAKQ